jgi:hypothetical protein
VKPFLSLPYIFLLSHGLNPRASTIFLFVLIRNGFPFSILATVIGDMSSLFGQFHFADHQFFSCLLDRAVAEILAPPLVFILNYMLLFFIVNILGIIKCNDKECPGHKSYP